MLYNAVIASLSQGGTRASRGGIPYDALSEISHYAEARQILDVGVLDTQTHFSIRLYCHGAVGMVSEWLLSDNITPAETIVRMMFASMPEPLKP